MKRIVRGLLLAALVSTGLTASAPAASACEREAMEYVSPVTFHVAIKPTAKSYRKGQRVPIRVTVSRPAEEDPVGLGVSFPRPAGQPAADVNVGVGLSIGRTFIPGFGRTDAAGKTTVRIKLPGYVPAGKTAHVRAFAYKTTVQTVCLTIEEQGFEEIPGAFRVKG